MSALGGMYYSELCTAIAKKLCVLTNGQLSGVVCLEIRPVLKTHQPPSKRYLQST